jgi:Protein of unknown function (DUF1559)
MHSYADEHGRLPPAVVYGENGRPLLSWRVLVLPFIEQGEIFRQFKLDEPWDSLHNIRLLPKMPPTYFPFDGSSPPESYTTFYQVFVGEGTAFEGREGLKLKGDFPNGTSNTFLVVEAGFAVPWTKPEDIPYDERKPLPKLGGLFKGSFRAALADGSVRSVLHGTKESTLRAVIVRNGGRPGDAPRKPSSGSGKQAWPSA